MKFFVEPSVEVLTLAVEDVIATSGGGEIGELPEDRD